MPATLRAAFYDGAAPVDVGEVSVEVLRDSDGEVVLQTVIGADAEQPGVYSAALAAQPDPDRLHATWTSAGAAHTIRQTVEAVGGFYFPLAALAATAGVSAPDDALADARELVERRIETATGVAWVPRYTRFTALSGDRLRLDGRPVRELVLAVDELGDVDLGELAVSPAGRLTRTRPWRGPSSIGYRYGHDAPPGDLADAALRAAADMVLLRRNQRAPERARELVAEGATINFSAHPDYARGRVFGMPDVDAVVMSYADRTVAIA